MHSFKAQIQIIGINPYVLLPDEVLKDIFIQAGKEKGNIPIKGKINGNTYKQTLVKYSGLWRLYINTTMLKNSPKHVGETVELTVEFDPIKRTVKQHPKLSHALKENVIAAAVFKGLRPSLQLEIVRYITNLKTEDAVDRNVPKAIAFLLGKGRFVGRDKP